jgi:hypothetical protein
MDPVRHGLLDVRFLPNNLDRTLLGDKTKGKTRTGTTTKTTTNNNPDTRKPTTATTNTTTPGYPGLATGAGK